MASSLRIIGGRFRGRRLQVPSGKNLDVRPTSDRVREAMFSALMARDLLRDAHVLDAFAGSGALGLEALSRGAASVTMIDQHPSILKTLRANTATLKVQKLVRVFRADIWDIDPPTLHANSAYNLLFLDPPYADTDKVFPRLAAWIRQTIVASDACIVLEHASSTSPNFPAFLALMAEYRYGGTGVTLLTPT